MVEWEGGYCTAEASCLLSKVRELSSTLHLAGGHLQD